MIDKQAIYTKNAPEVIGPYSQAIKINNVVYLSGQIPFDPETNQLITHSIEAEIHQVFNNLSNVAAANAQLQNVSYYEFQPEYVTHEEQYTVQVPEKRVRHAPGRRNADRYRTKAGKIHGVGPIPRKGPGPVSDSLLRSQAHYRTGAKRCLRRR